MSVVVWALVVMGVTTIITQSSLLFPIREWSENRFRSTFLSCSMCVGFWVGIVASSVFKLGVAPELPYWTGFRWLADGCASSMACWTAYVVLRALGADRL